MKTYEALIARAERALAAGRAVIIDAVFAHESERRAAENLAKRMGVGEAVLLREALDDVLRKYNA